MHRRHFCLGTTLLFASRNAGADTDTADCLARVGRARNHLRTLQGPFQQTRSIGLLATDIVSRGTFVLVRPNQLRWDLAPPDAVTFWLSPEGLAYRTTHGSGRVPAAAARIGSALDDLRTVLGGDLTKLLDRWDLRIARDDASGAEIEATPRPGVEARLHSLRFSLAADLRLPTRVVLVEGPRDHTIIEFGTLVVDATVEDARMKPPV